jgi:hypothetical protein
MKIKKVFVYLLVLFILTAFSPSLSFGQTTQAGNFLEISMVPENPEPLQGVKLTLKSSAYDLNRSTITWSVDDKIKGTNIGLKELNILAGKNGQKTNIKISVKTPNDGEKNLEAFFIPSLVDLIYETHSYVPPFYKGKSLNPNQGVVSVTAIPELINNQGVRIPTQNILYSWKKDGEIQESSSGVGKNTFTFNGTLPIRDAIISVNASSLDGNIYAAKQIKIASIYPKIIFYENHPLYGLMFNQAIKNTVKMTEVEFSVLAIPYFFSTGYANNPDIEYNWRMNENSLLNQEPRNAFTAKIESALSGTAGIGLKTNDVNRPFQYSSSGFVINFEKR